MAAESPQFKSLGAPHEVWPKLKARADFEKENEKYATEIVKWLKKTINA